MTYKELQNSDTWNRARECHRGRAPFTQAWFLLLSVRSFIGVAGFLFFLSWGRLINSVVLAAYT